MCWCPAHLRIGNHTAIFSIDCSTKKLPGAQRTSRASGAVTSFAGKSCEPDHHRRPAWVEKEREAAKAIEPCPKRQLCTSGQKVRLRTFVGLRVRSISWRR